MKLEVIIEKNENMLWGYIAEKGDFLPGARARTIREVLKNLKIVIRDYQQHEGREDGYWKKVILEKIDWVICYNLQAFFLEHDYLNIAAIARRAGLSPSLVRDYKAGVRHPSEMQVRKLEHAIREIAESLRKVKVHGR